jgi:hypothetical protein
MKPALKRDALLALKSLGLGYFVMCATVAMDAIPSGVYDPRSFENGLVAGGIFAVMNFYFWWRASRRAPAAAESGSLTISS